ncbi:hypothetical protein BO94DRAFT_564453 [Aspergillus sclerotioniger CBS 115572]|uniref:Uncharacterized protein n=1 Tax=Aspergillus sclerotioniger CBS 115572 TaxID=1450535 RepID=A0A317X090_9EURO|nr:hypothetical protein BO94DRAFT_564453 [Aspergillus sclerotioniger CBS 115572]PWY91685.1 hypothetical protein BO94DRAFT_564453 [Aspergillus sclerotioniger CBS 115572]
MSLRNPLSSLKISRGRLQEHVVAGDETFEDARKEMQGDLKRTHEHVKAIPLSSLTRKQAARYDIICETLTLRTDAGYASTERVYFKPWSLLKLQQHPIDHSDRETGCDDDSDEDDTGAFLCNVLVYEFMQYARDGQPPGNTLEYLSGWYGGSFDRKILKSRYMDLAMFSDPHRNPLASPPLSFDAVWYRYLPQELPHISLIVSYGGVGNDNLLRSEVLALVGIMRTRLGQTELREHTIAPVLMISCIGFLKARIIQAYYTNGRLMMLKSPLHDFSTPEARGINIPLFLLYMCSDCIGDTKALSREIPLNEDTNP